MFDNLTSVSNLKKCYYDPFHQKARFRFSNPEAGRDARGGVDQGDCVDRTGFEAHHYRAAREHLQRVADLDLEDQARIWL